MRRSQGAVATLLAVVAATLVVLPPASGAGAAPATRATAATRAAGADGADGADGVDAVAVGWHPCAEAPAPFECAEVTVPVDHSRPGGRQREVAAIRRPAPGPGPSLGTLLVNPGGPGVSGLVYLPAAVPALLDRLGQRFDLVSFDPRGVGESGPVRCLDDADRDAMISRARGFPGRRDLPTLLVDAVRLVAGCAFRHGGGLRQLSTATTARDMDAIRAALGVEKISYLGFSYGTYLGATYASLFPHRLRALVLDGAVDPAQTARDPLQKDIDQAAGFEIGLGRFLDHCDATPSGCAFSGGARARLSQILARVENRPLPAPNHDPSRPVTSHTLVTGIEAALYARQSWPFLGVALALAEAGDGSLVQLASDSFIGRDDAGRYQQWVDAYPAIVAVDRDYPRSPLRFLTAAAAARERAPTFGALNVLSSLPAGLWPFEPAEVFAGPFHFRPAHAPPALVVGTTFDTATPYRGAEAMTRQLGHAVLLTMDGDGHTAYGRGSPCVDAAVDAYLVALTVPPAGQVCRQTQTSAAAAVAAGGLGIPGLIEGAGG